MTIGDLARAADCTTETVRYYEKQGLLPKPERGGNNYRTYGAGHLERLRFVRNCRALDLSQAEIGGLLALMQRPSADCDSVNTVLDAHIADVEARLRELRSLRDQLLTLRKECQSKSTVGRCRILHGISHLGENGTHHAH